MTHYNILKICFRSSRAEVFCKKGIFRNFAKVIGKHLCQSLFFNKFSGWLTPATLLKKRLWQFVKFCEFCEISKKTFSYRIPPGAASIVLDMEGN